MGKVAPDIILDAALDLVATGTRWCACSAEPTNYTEAITTYKLADVDVTAGDGNGDYTIANGDTSGRKLTMTAKSAVTVDTTGTANHLAIVDVSGTTLLYVTTCTSTALTNPGTVDFAAWDIEIADPT